MGWRFISFTASQPISCADTLIYRSRVPDSVLGDQIRDFLIRQRLGFVATVSPDGSPNVSPKGTIFVWDQSTLIFADIRSPQTVTNLQTNPRLEINVVDPILRRGYRFRGRGRVLEEGQPYLRMLEFYADLGIKSKIHRIVQVYVDDVSEVTSPLYDTGISEDEIARTWRARLLSG